MSYTYRWPRPSVAADAALFRRREGELEVLLIQRRNPPFKGRWCMPGGFLNLNEAAETAARRELREETGLPVGRLTQVYAFTDPKRDPRGHVIAITHTALINGKRSEPKASSDAAGARWFPVRRLPPLAYDHDRAIRMALEKLGLGRPRTRRKP